MCFCFHSLFHLTLHLKFPLAHIIYRLASASLWVPFLCCSNDHFRETVPISSQLSGLAQSHMSVRYGCMYADMHIPIEDRGHPPVVFLRCHLSWFLRQSPSLIAWSLTSRLRWLARKQPSLLPQYQATGMHHYRWIFHWVLRIKLRSSCLGGEHHKG